MPLLLLLLPPALPCPPVCCCVLNHLSISLAVTCSSRCCRVGVMNLLLLLHLLLWRLLLKVCRQSDLQGVCH
jgi:hypothetical protein